MPYYYRSLHTKDLYVSDSQLIDSTGKPLTSVNPETGEDIHYTAERIHFTRLSQDTNGNGRLVCLWTNIPGATSYAEAVKLAHKIGGRKYHNRKFGGGIVFQESSENELQRLIETLK